MLGQTCLPMDPQPHSQYTTYNTTAKKAKSQDVPSCAYGRLWNIWVGGRKIRNCSTENKSSKRVWESPLVKIFSWRTEIMLEMYCSLVSFLPVFFCMNSMPFFFGCSNFSSCSQRCYKLAKSLSYIFPFLLQETDAEKRTEKSNLQLSASRRREREREKERTSGETANTCRNAGILLRSIPVFLGWMVRKERRRRKEPDSFSLFVSSRFMKIAKKGKGGNGLLANEGRRLVIANK